MGSIPPRKVRQAFKLPTDSGVAIIRNLKSSVKRGDVDLSDVPEYLEALVDAFKDDKDHHRNIAFKSASFAAICALCRLTLTEDHKYLADSVPLVMPVLINHLEDSSPSKETAARTIGDVWLVLPEPVEVALREQGLVHAESSVRLACLRLLTDHITQLAGKISFKPFSPVIVDRLVDPSPQVRVAAYALVVRFFSYASVPAKADLELEMRRKNTPNPIVAKLASKLGLKLTSPLGPVPSSRINSIRERSATDKPYPMHRPGEPEKPKQERPANTNPPIRAPAVPPLSQRGQVGPAANLAPAAIVAGPDFMSTIATNPQYAPENLQPEDVQSIGQFKTDIQGLMAPFAGKESEHNWEAREATINRIRRVLRGNMFDYPGDLAWELRRFSDEISKAILSVRTTLCLAALNLVKDAAQLMRSFFDPLIEVFLPPLVKVCCSSKKITSSLAQLCVCSSIINSSYSSRYLSHITAAFAEKNSKARLYAVQWLHVLILVHQAKIKNILEATSGDELIGRIVLAAVEDSNPEVRVAGRPVYWLFGVLWPQRAEQMASKLHPRTRKYLLQSHPPELSEAVDFQASQTRPTSQRINVEATPQKDGAASASFEASTKIPDIYRRLSRALNQGTSSTAPVTTETQEMVAIEMKETKVGALIDTLPPEPDQDSKPEAGQDAGQEEDRSSQEKEGSDDAKTEIDNVGTKSNAEPDRESASGRFDEPARPKRRNSGESNSEEAGQVIATNAPEIAVDDTATEAPVKAEVPAAKISDAPAATPATTATDTVPTSLSTPDAASAASNPNPDLANQDDEDRKAFIQSAAEMVEEQVRQAHSGKKDGSKSESSAASENGDDDDKDSKDGEEGNKKAGSSDIPDGSEAPAKAGSGEPPKDRDGGALDDALAEVTKRMDGKEEQTHSKLSSLKELLTAEDVGTMKDGLNIVSFLIRGQKPPAALVSGLGSVELPSNDIVGKALFFVFSKATENVPGVQTLVVQYMSPDLVATTLDYVGHAVLLFAAVHLLPAEVLFVVFQIIAPLLDVGMLVDTLFEIVTSDSISEAAMLAIGQLLLRFDKIPLTPALRTKAKAALEVIYRFGDLAQDVMEFLSDWIGFHSDDENSTDSDDDSDEEEIAKKHQQKYERKFQKPRDPGATALAVTSIAMKKVMREQETDLVMTDIVVADTPVVDNNTNSTRSAESAASASPSTAGTDGAGQDSAGQTPDQTQAQSADQNTAKTPVPVEDFVYSTSVRSVHPISVSYKPAAGNTKSVRRIRKPVHVGRTFSDKKELSPFSKVNEGYGDALLRLPQYPSEIQASLNSVVSALESGDIDEEGLMLLVMAVSGSANHLDDALENLERLEAASGEATPNDPTLNLLKAWNGTAEFEQRTKRQILWYIEEVQDLSELRTAMCLLLIDQLLRKGSYSSDFEYMKVLNCLIAVSGTRQSESTTQTALPKTLNSLLSRPDINLYDTLRALTDTYDTSNNRSAQIFVLQTIRNVLKRGVDKTPDLANVVTRALTKSDIYVRKEAYPVLLLIHRRSPDAFNQIWTKMAPGQQRLFEYYSEYEDQN